MPPGHAVVTCLACRLSKVKCERQPDAVACTRCTRLGLVCASSGVKKRGAQNVKRDVARLGPAVRSLLANGAAAEASTPASALTCASYRFDVAPVAWCGPRCPALLMSQIESPVGRLALLQHWICIALRSGSCAMLGNVLLLAHLGGLTLAKVQALACDPSVVAPTEAISMPLFISEWQSLPSPVFTRTQVNGKIEFLPNQGFDQAFGNLTEMTARLGPATAICTNAVITELKPQVLVPSSSDVYSLAPRDGADPTETICASETLLAQFIHPDDTMKFMQLNASLWSSLRGGGSTDEMRAEISSPEPVHIKLAGSDSYSPCAIRGRIAWHPSSRRVWTVIDLAPQPVSPAAPQPVFPAPPATDSGLFAPLQPNGALAGGYAHPAAADGRSLQSPPLPLALTARAAPSTAPLPSAPPQYAAPHALVPAAPSAEGGTGGYGTGDGSSTGDLSTMDGSTMDGSPDDSSPGDGSFGENSVMEGDISMEIMEDLALSTDELVSLLARVQEEPGDEAHRGAGAAGLAEAGAAPVAAGLAEQAPGGMAQQANRPLHQPPPQMQTQTHPKPPYAHPQLYSQSQLHPEKPSSLGSAPLAGMVPLAGGVVREQLQTLRALHTDGLLDESVYRKRQEDLLRMM